MTRRGRYPDEIRERAVRMLFEHRHEYPTEWAAIQSISEKVGVHKETLRIWVRRAQVDASQRPGLTTDERERLKQLERKNRELPRANEILKSASAFFAAETRMTRYIDANKEEFGFEPICRVLQFAPATYYTDRSRQPSPRAVRDEALKPEVTRVYTENRRVYGVCDITYVKTHSGWVYVAVVIDVFSRRIVGWQVSRSLRTDLALDALEMAMWAQREDDLSGLIHHSDRGVQGGFKWCAVNPRPSGGPSTGSCLVINCPPKRMNSKSLLSGHTSKDSRSSPSETP